MQCVHLWLGRGAKQFSTLTSLTLPPLLPATKNNTTNYSRSMNEFAEVAEKILQNVNAVFEKDESLDEFDIVPQETQANRSPVIHHQHKLGLESWCTGFVYTHSFRNFILLRPRKSVQSNASEVSQVNSLDDLNDSCSYKNNNANYSQLTECEKWTRCLEVTRLLVLLNPDLSVAWNFRREAFKHGYAELKDELLLVTLILSRKPKCSEGFYYRRWLVKEALNNRLINMEQTLNFFQSEAKAALQAASKYSSNYHAWDYRLFLMETWLQHNDVPVDVKNDILNIEKQVSDTWLNSHISDYCGYHYRQKLLLYFITLQLSETESKELLLNELKENQGMILFYPGHESLWCHRKILIKQYIGLFGNLKSHEDLRLTVENERKLVDLVGMKSQKNENDEKYNTLPISDYIQLNNMFSERYLRWVEACAK